MCSGPSYTPPPPPPPPPAPPKPMVSPESGGAVAAGGGPIDASMANRKGRNSLKIDLATGGSNTSGLNIPS